MSLMTNEQFAKRMGCSVEALREQAKKCAAQARECEAKARASGKKYRGYTADEWAHSAAAMDRKSVE